MKLPVVSWSAVQELCSIEKERKFPSDDKEWKEFIVDLREEIIEFKERMNTTIAQLNDWASKVRLAANKINPRYQFQGTIVTLTIEADEVGGEMSVAHGLKYTPSYWNVLDSTIAGYICRSKAFDGTNCYFKAGATGTATIAVW